MKTIPLTHGKVALVDDDDYALVAQHKWHYHPVKRSSRGLGYAATNRRDSTGHHLLLMHRLIMNAPKGSEVDHGDGDGLNNQRHNLEFVDDSANGQRQHTIRGASRYQGVTWFSKAGRWGARIECGDTRHFLGLFDIEHDAALAYDEAAVRLFGSRAKRNLPPGSTYIVHDPHRPKPARTHCKWGHELTEENTRPYRKGAVLCRQCWRIYHQRYATRKRQGLIATKGAGHAD